MSNSTTSSTDTASAGTGKASVEDLRKLIDAEDLKIQTALARRKAISTWIQEVKQSEGKPKTDLNRELVVIADYRAKLGPDGSILAVDILTYSKG